MGRIKINLESITILERHIPSDISGMKIGQVRYSVLINKLGNLVDDLLVYRLKESILLVVNASRLKEVLRNLLEISGLLFKELKNIIKEYHKKDEPLWFQCWLNYHSDNQVLDWHDHQWLWHGYISIDPKETKTIFENGFEVKNEIGNIYIGPCNIKHKVVVNKPYFGHRITLGFDVISVPDYPINTTSFMPI